MPKSMPSKLMPLLVSLAGAIWTLWGVVSAPQRSGTDLRAIRQQGAEQVALAKIAEERARQLAEIAERRYQSGCLLIFSSLDRQQAVLLAEGVPILDFFTKKALPKGAIVCDTGGNTGVIGENGIPHSLAFTGNQEVILNRIRGSNLRMAQIVQEKKP